ncbi:MAG: helix-turn-helix domain-containing protein [Planctomycetota bacterium]
MPKLLTTSEFAESLGMSRSSVRRLADAGDVKTHRTKGGHRKIPVEEAIRYIRDNGITPSNPELLGLNWSTENCSPEAFYDSLIDGESDSAVGILQQMYLGGLRSSEIFDGPVFEALVRIGDEFPQDKRSIFIEHRAVVICTRALMQLRTIMPAVAKNAPKSICAAPAGDPYLLPCLMCSLVLHEEGYHEINLGADTPIDVIHDSIEDEQPKIISLSITAAIRSRSQLSEIGKLQTTGQQNGCNLIIGGQNAGFVDLPGIRVGRSMTELAQFASALKTEA